MEQYVIELEHVDKMFKGNEVLSDVNLQLEPSVICGIVGRNGSGKSVLLKMIAGLITPTNGSVKVHGEMLREGHYAKDTGIILDCTGFLPEYTARENLRMLANIKRLVSKEDIDAIIRKVGLDPNARQAYRKFSLGMKQKLAIAQAFMETPKLLLLDEPMNALDEESVAEMRVFFREYVERTGAAIIMTSHNREDIQSLCDVTYRIRDGKLTAFQWEEE